jgi:phosphatidate cytidylyltransferase
LAGWILDSVPTPNRVVEVVAPAPGPAGSGSHRGGLPVRLATAGIGIPLTVIFIVLGAPWLAFGVAAVIIMGIAEFYRMIERIGYRPVWEAGMGAGVLFALDAAWPRPWGGAILPALLVYTLVIYLRRGRPERILANTALTVFGALYVGYLMSYILRLRALDAGPAHSAGPAAALLVVFSVWAADSAAYFVGLSAGRRKLLPHVSPNKSVEGAAGGVAAGIFAGLICGGVFHLALPMAAAVGGVCAVASILGDLWESAIKREVGVKDAGGILPGHGGILDRFDGLLFAIVVGYFTIRWWPGP